MFCWHRNSDQSTPTTFPMNRRVDIVGGTHQDHGPLQVAEQLAICIEYLQIKLFKPINLNFIGE